MTYSFPCQDLSLAGNQKGMSKGKGTRSGMLWEVERILEELSETAALPQILLMENVPQVIGTKNVNDFNKWQSKLEQLGYKNYHENLIATDYGIPQTRNRTFMISILSENGIDYNYTFPKKQKLELCLKDKLEEFVEEKFFLSDKMIDFFRKNEIKQKEKGNGFKFNVSDGNVIAKTITTKSGSRMDDNFIEVKNKKIYLKDFLEKNVDESYFLSDKMINYIQSRMPSGDHHVTSGINITNINENTKAGTLVTNEGNQPSCNFIIESNHVYSKEKGIIIPCDTKQGYMIAYDGDGVYINRPHQKRGTVQNQMIQTLKTGTDVGVVVEKEKLRIRKLTPRECFRLMGVCDEDFDRIKNNQSNSSLYHLAGDSIVTNVLMAIFKQLI